MPYSIKDAAYFEDEDLMERHIDRIRVFRAMASPSYMALTYTNDPVEHAFNMAKRAELGIQREPEFKDQFIEIGKTCKAFAVAVLNSCRTSSEVEMVLDDNYTKIKTQNGYTIDVSRTGSYITISNRIILQFCYIFYILYIFYLFR